MCISKCFYFSIIIFNSTIIFKKIVQINFRNETINLKKNINFNNLYLYYGIVKEYSGILISTEELIDTLELTNYTNKQYNDLIISQYELNKILNNTGNVICKPIEIFTETNKVYTQISLPYINSILDKNTKWINALVFDYSEESIVLFRNNDFVICKDIIWKNNDGNNFYILVIPIKKN